MTIFLNGRRPQGVTLQRGDDETMRKMKMLLALSGIWGVIWFMSLPTAVDRKNVQEMFEQHANTPSKPTLLSKSAASFWMMLKNIKITIQASISSAAIYGWCVMLLQMSIPS